MDVTLCLTHDCNLACTYCYAGHKHKKVMTWETAERALDFSFDHAAKEVQLGFFGGEPLLEWELMQRSTDRAEALAKEKDILLRKTVTTNATLITPAILAWLKEHEFYPSLSIDGNRAMHDITRPLRGGKSSFDQCMKGLDLSLGVFNDIEVIIVPDPSNVEHLAESVRFLAEEKNVLRISINPNFYTEWSDEALEIWRSASDDIGDLFLARYRDGRPLAMNFIDGKVITRLKKGFECRDKCNFGEREIAVAPSGNIYPCERLVSDDSNEEMCIGNVFDGFDEEKRGKILSRRGCVNSECITCSIKHRCMNWCCCINYALTGAIDTTDGIVCFHERMAVEVADRVGGALFAEANPAFVARFYDEDFEDVEVASEEASGTEAEKARAE